MNLGAPENKGLSEDEFLKLGAAQDEPEQKTNAPSKGGSFVREAGRSVLPGAAGVLSGAAAAAGTAALVSGPAAPVVVPIAGLAGGIYGGMKAREYQDQVADEVAPDSFMGTKSAQADAEANPISTFAGSLVGMGKPSLSSIGGAVKAFGTTAGRQGIKTIAKQIGSKEARDAVKKATTETIDGTLTPEAIKAAEAQRIAGEHFGHAIGSAGGVGAMTGMGIAEGEDPGTAALKGVAGLAVKPWVGPGGVFLDPFKSKSSGQTGDSFQTKGETETEDDITGTSEDILGNAEKDLAEATSQVSAAADAADQAGATETASALRETLTKKPRIRKTNKTASSVESTTTQPATNLKDEIQTTEEPATENASTQVEATGQQIPPEQNADQTDVLSEVSDEESVEPPLESSADEQNPQGASAATETPAASQAAAPVEQIRTPEQYLDNRGGLGRLRLNERLAPTKRNPQGQPSLSELIYVAIRDQDLESLQWLHNEMQIRQGTKPSFQKEQLLRQARNAIVNLTGEAPVNPSLRVTGDNGAPRVVKGGPELNPALQAAAKRALATEREPLLSGTREPVSEERASELPEEIDDAEIPDEAFEEEDEEGEFEIDATEAARDFAEEKGINLAEVVARNQNGKITKGDVQKHLNQLREQRAQANSPQTPETEAATEAPQERYWYNSPESKKFWEKFEELKAKLGRSISSKQNEKIYQEFENLKKSYRQDTENFQRVDLIDPQAKIYDGEGLPLDGETASLAGAQWKEWASERVGSLNLREVALADGTTAHIDLDTLPKVTEEQINANTPTDLKSNIRAIEMATGHTWKTLKSWAKLGMPTGDIEQSKAWIENYKREKAIGSATNRQAKNSGLSLDASVGDGTATVGDTYVGSNPSEPTAEKENVASGIVGRAVAHMARQDVPLVRRLALGKMLLRGEVADRIGMSDEEYKLVSSAYDQLEAGLYPSAEATKNQNLTEEGASKDELEGAFESAEGRLIQLESVEGDVTREKIVDLAEWMKSKGILSDEDFNELSNRQIEKAGEERVLNNPEEMLELLKTKFEASKNLYAAAKEAWAKEDGTRSNTPQTAEQAEAIEEEARAMSEREDISPDELMDNVDGGGGFQVDPLRSRGTGSQDNTAKESRGALVRTMHAGDLLTQVQNSREASTFARVVAKFLEKSRVRLEKIPTDIYERLESGTYGEYDRQNKRIGLPEEFNPDVALHEILHALTQGGGFHSGEIKRLYIKIRNEAVKRGLTSEEQWTRAADPEALNKTDDDEFHYAFSSHDEMIAGLLNPKVREALNSIELRDEVTGKISNAWELLKAKFLQYLGFKVKAGSALDKYLTHVMELAAPEGKTTDEKYYTKDQDSTLDAQEGDGVLYANAQNSKEPSDQAKRFAEFRRKRLERNQAVHSGGERSVLQDAIGITERAPGGNASTAGRGWAEAGLESLRSLEDWADKNGKVIPGNKILSELRSNRALDEGSEHSVVKTLDGKRVIKVTHDDPVGTGVVGQSSNVNDYLKGLEYQNILFGRDNPESHFLFEGITYLDGAEGRPQIVISQPFIGGKKATEAQISKFFKDLRFVKKDGSWVGERDGFRYVVSDAVPANVKAFKDSQGNTIVHPIDVQVSREPVAQAPLRAIKTTTAFEEPNKLFSAELQKALGDVKYSSFQWKEDAGQVSKWLNDSAANNGSTWETLVLDLTSPDPTPGLSDRQKMVGKFMLTQSLDKAATELRGKGNTTEAARYNKLAKTLFKSAKLDASAYGQGLNSVRMLTELINGNTALSEYVDPISKVHYEKLAGKTEVADILGTLKGSMETGADTTVAKAGPLLEKIKGQLSGAEIARIVKEALLNPESSIESLSAQLAETANLPVEKVTSVADALRKAFAVEARKSAREELEKLVKNAQSREERAKIKKIVDSDSDKLMRLIGMGAMSEEKYYNAIAKTYDLPSWDPVFAKFVEKEGGKISALPESMKDYRQQRTQRLIGEIARKVRTEKLNNKDAGEIADVLTNFWQLGVLSGPPTQVVNAVASGISVLGESLVESVGAAFHTKDSKHIVEVFSGFLQAITGNKGTQGALGQEFFRALSEGTSKYKNSKGETLSSMETLPEEKDLQGAMKLVSRYGNALKYVGRSMAAFDSANMALAEAAAERKATRYYLQTEKGLKGGDLESAMNDLFNPGETTIQKFRTQAEDEVKAGYYAEESPANQQRWVERRVNELLSQRREELTGGEISEKAIQAAERFTYNDDARGILGQFAGFMNQINQETKVSKFVISFMKTMMNLVNQTIDWSPYGALRAANKSFSQSRFKEGSRFDPYRYEEGSPEQYAQYARAILGTMAWTGLAYLAYKGLEDEKNGKPPTFSIHGSGPSNAYDRQQLLATRNWQPNSIRVGNTWLRYTDWPVLGIALGGMGSFFDSQRYAKDDSTTSEKLFAGVMATASTILDKNMLQGVSNLFEGIRQSNSPTQQANALKRLVSGSVGGFTNPGLARWARNSFYADKDGMVNRLDQSTTEGWLYSMVPFSMGYNTPALNTLGEPLQQPWYSATMWRFADVNGVPPHPIITPLVKAGLMLPNPSKNTEFRYLDKMGDVQKTKVGKYPEINRRFVELRGQAMKELLTPEAIGDLSRAAKENVNEAQTYLDSRVGGQARKYAISIIEQEIQEGKLSLDAGK